MISFFNTLSGKKEPFIPIDDAHVRMYHCGPTVYDDPHIGNLRSFILADLIRRTLEHAKYNVTQVINITDIGVLSHDEAGEDKMARALRREKKEVTLAAMKELGAFYTQRFTQNLLDLNIHQPHHLVAATDHIQEQIDLIQTLETKGFTYLLDDGIYFDTSQFPEYGALGNIKLEGQLAGARVKTNDSKKHPTDFALWKFNIEFGFPSPWGTGTPGWHIECSAMSMKYLGETFDIHTGGIDLIPTHHNNEIAQSTCATGKTFVNYWLHNAHINLGEEKMAKSEGTGITLATLREHNIHPLSYRYFLLGAHYRSPLSFSFEAVHGAQNSLEKILEFYIECGSETDGKPNAHYINQFQTFIDDDLDTPRALTLLHEITKDKSLTGADAKATLDDIDSVLGLSLKNLSENMVVTEIPSEIQSLLDDRAKARGAKDWKRADELRDRVSTLGFEIRDTDSETRIIRPLRAISEL